MYTQCPKCQAVFTIAQDQLDHRDGVVRCGACMGVFDAASNLYEQISEIDSPPSEQGGAVDVPVLGGTEQPSLAIEVDDEEADADETVLGYEPEELIDNVEAQLSDIDLENTGDFDVEQIEMETPQWAHTFDEADTAPDPDADLAPLSASELNDVKSTAVPQPLSVPEPKPAPHTLSVPESEPAPQPLTVPEPEPAPQPLNVAEKDKTPASPVPYSVAGFVNKPSPTASVFGSSAARVADQDPDSLSVEELTEMPSDLDATEGIEVTAASIVEPDLPDEFESTPAAEPLIWPSSDGSDQKLQRETAKPAVSSKQPSSEMLIEPAPAIADSMPDIGSASLSAAEDGLSLDSADLGDLGDSEVALSVQQTGKSDEVFLSVDAIEEDDDDTLLVPDAADDGLSFELSDPAESVVDETLEASLPAIAPDIVEMPVAGEPSELLSSVPSDASTDFERTDQGSADLEASIEAAFATDAPIELSDDVVLTKEPVAKLPDNLAPMPDLSDEIQPVEIDVDLVDDPEIEAAADAYIALEEEAEQMPQAPVPAAVETDVAPVLSAPVLPKEDARIVPTLQTHPVIDPGDAMAAIESPVDPGIELGDVEEPVAEIVAPLAPNATTSYVEDEDVEFDDDEFLARTGMDFDADIDSELVSELEFVAQLERAGADDLDFDSEDFMEHHSPEGFDSPLGSPSSPASPAKTHAAELVPGLVDPVTYGAEVKPVPAWRTWVTRAGLGLGCLALVGTLVWQAKSFYLEDLAQISAMRPVLNTVCSVTGCEVPPRRSPDHMSLIATYIDSHPEQPDALRIATQITNSAGFAQPYPNVRLTMTDKRGRIVARRDVTPEEYLAIADTNQAVIAPGQTEQVFFDLMDPRDDAFGYEVELLAAE